MNRVAQLYLEAPRNDSQGYGGDIRRRIRIRSGETCPQSCALATVVVLFTQLLFGNGSACRNVMYCACDLGRSV
jgi:hypothetical protein